MWAAILYGAEQMCVFKLASSINATRFRINSCCPKIGKKCKLKNKKKEKKKIQLLHIEQLLD